MELPEGSPERRTIPPVADLIVCKVFPPELGVSPRRGPAHPHNILWYGLGDEVYLPFGVKSDEGNVLSEEYLVKQGTEQPLGEPNNYELVGSRTLHSFRWTISEAYPIGSGEVEDVGSLEGARWGIPQDSEERERFLKDWKSESIDPHFPYMLVVTFYQKKPFAGDDRMVFDEPDSAHSRLIAQGHGVDYKATQLVLDAGEEKGVFRLPQRSIRQVVCRMIIVPSGIQPDSADQTNVLQDAWAWIKGESSVILNSLMGWLRDIYLAVAEVPENLMGRLTKTVCIGIEQIEGIGAREEFSATSRRLAPGWIVISPVERDRAGEQGGLRGWREAVQEELLRSGFCFHQFQHRPLRPNSPVEDEGCRQHVRAARG